MRVLKKVISALLIAVMVIAATGMMPQHSLTAQAAGYKIKINRATNVVTIYNSDGKPIKAMTCSTGGSNTPLGNFSAGQKYRWQTLDGPCYGQYCTRITGHVLFHSVWYYSYDLNSQSTVQYNRLGTAASHGCVRLTVADAKWIYENISSGTSITIFSGSEADDPLGKPKTIKVSEATRGGWDPTDPDPNNPYKALRPKIDVSHITKEVGYGKKSNFKTAVLAYDSGGGDISDDVKVKGKVDTKELGTYKITYSVMDALGQQCQKSIKIKVVDKNKAKITGYESPLKLEIDTKYNLKKDLTVKTVDGTNLRKSMTVSVKAPGEDEFKKLSSSSYTFKEAGTYIVEYKVKNPHNGKVTIRKMKVKVTDSGAPVIKGDMYDDEFEVGDEDDLMLDVTAKTRDGVDLTADIVVTVTLPDETEVTPEMVDGRMDFTFELEGKYTITYTVADPDTGITAKVSKVYTVVTE